MNSLQTRELNASPDKVKAFVEHALGKYNGEASEERADDKFVEIASIKEFFSEVIDQYMDSVAEDNIASLTDANARIVDETQQTNAISSGNMQDYIQGMSGLVGRACEAVGLATKVQAAKNRDFDGYKAELSDRASEMLDSAKQQISGNGQSRLS